MQKLFVTILGIIFVNALFTLLPSINASIARGTLIVYQFYFNSLFILSFLLQNRISFPQPENEKKQFFMEAADNLKKKLDIRLNNDTY
jgi:hypothetical protein